MYVNLYENFIQKPKFETLTKETVQTFRGNRTERKVTSETKNTEETIDNKLGMYVQV